MTFGCLLVSKNKALFHTLCPKHNFMEWYFCPDPREAPAAVHPGVVRPGARAAGRAQEDPVRGLPGAPALRGHFIVLLFCVTVFQFPYSIYMQKNFSIMSQDLCLWYRYNFQNTSVCDDLRHTDRALVHTVRALVGVVRLIIVFFNAIKDKRSRRAVTLAERL